MDRGIAFFLFTGISIGFAGPAVGQALDERPGQRNLVKDSETFFETKVRPILTDHCVKCHGPTKASGGLRLDSRDGLFQGGDSGAAVTPGDADGSLLARAIKHDQGEPIQMPPKVPLPPQVVADIHAWIAAGAKWPDRANIPTASQKSHWAFDSLQNQSAPDDPTDWATQEIDRFIAAGHRQHDVRPVGPAEKHVLMRRAHFDLLGLPPSPEETDAFTGDERPDAMDRYVDRLLASPHYGERWGRHWLDLVRYADTAGDNSDYPIPQAYLYRDYCIDAFNADVPYDRFLHEQLAGDILARDANKSDYRRLVIATGFIAQAKRIGTRELEDMHIIIEDTLATLGPAVLGLSVRCARCHDHKYEPITQRDYYALYGIFASTQYPFAGAEEVRKQTKFAPLLHPEDLQALRESRDRQIAELKDQIELLKAGPTAPVERLAEEIKQLSEQLAALEKSDPLAAVPTAYAVGELAPVDVRLQRNGNPRTTGDVVARGIPSILDRGEFRIPDGTSGRLSLAHWITETAGSLAARVMVNRIWQYHFGSPLVSTPSDFGLRGAPPTHPELLDRLAENFIESGWSIKSMHRRMMLSGTYQLSSDTNAFNAEQDSGNAWYWRFNRRRLDAEALRDSILALGGTLDLSRPGAHPFPEPSTWRFTAHKQFNQVCYPSNHRSVYLMVQRLHAHPYLSLFNGPDASLSTPTRDTSTVPLQSLFLMNNELIHRESSGFARSLIQQHSDSRSRIQLAFHRAFARSPSDEEQIRLLVLLKQYEQALEDEGHSGEAMEIEAWSALARTFMRSNEFFFVD